MELTGVEPKEIEGVIRNKTTNMETPFYLTLGIDPFDDIVEIDIDTRGDHPTISLQLEDNMPLIHCLQLVNCCKSTPSARIRRWRSTLHYSFPLTIGDTTIHNQQHTIIHPNC